MALTITSPATLFDAADLVGASTPLMWRVAREMLAGGETVAAHLDGRAVAIGGIYPLAENAGECWFNVTPEASAHMLQIVRAMRLTIRGSHYREIVVLCTSLAGVRIARSLGFLFFEQTELGEVWTCHRCLAGVPPRSS